MKPLEEMDRYSLSHMGFVFPFALEALTCLQGRMIKWNNNHRHKRSVRYIRCKPLRTEKNPLFCSAAAMEISRNSFYKYSNFPP